MQFVKTLHGQYFRIIVLPKKGVNYKKLCIPTKHRKPNFYMINIHTQGYITLNKYTVGNDKLYVCMDDDLFSFTNNFVKKIFDGERITMGDLNFRQSTLDRKTSQNSFF